MGLIENLKEGKAKTGGVPRKLDTLMQKLEVSELAALEEALGSSEWSSAGISRALRASGHNISSTAVKRYRKDVMGMVFDD